MWNGYHQHVTVTTPTAKLTFEVFLLQNPKCFPARKDQKYLFFPEPLNFGRPFNTSEQKRVSSAYLKIIDGLR